MTSETQKPLLLSIWHRIKHIFFGERNILEGSANAAAPNNNLYWQVRFLERCLRRECEAKSFETKRYGAEMDSLWLEHCWSLEYRQSDVSA